MKLRNVKNDSELPQIPYDVNNIIRKNPRIDNNIRRDAHVRPNSHQQMSYNNYFNRIKGKLILHFVNYKFYYIFVFVTLVYLLGLPFHGHCLFILSVILFIYPYVLYIPHTINYFIINVVRPLQTLIKDLKIPKKFIFICGLMCITGIIIYYFIMLLNEVTLIFNVVKNFLTMYIQKINKPEKYVTKYKALNCTLQFD